MTNIILHLLLNGSAIVFPAMSEHELYLSSASGNYPHSSTQEWAATETAFNDLRDGYTTATYNGDGTVTVDGVAYAEYVTPPVDFPAGIAIPALTNASKFYSIHPIEGSTDVIAVEAHASPYDPEAHRARIEAEVSRRQAIKDELGLTQQQIDAIRTYFTADVDAIFPTLTAAQRQFLKVQRAAVRYLLKQEVREVTAP